MELAFARQARVDRGKDALAVLVCGRMGRLGVCGMRGQVLFEPLYAQPVCEFIFAVGEFGSGSVGVAAVELN